MASKAIFMNMLFYCLLIASNLLSGCQNAQQKSLIDPHKELPKNYVAKGNQYTHDGLLREAAREYGRAISVNPKNDEAKRNLGIVLVKLGDYKNGSKHLQSSLQTYDKNFEANFFLGESHRALNEYAEAIFFYKKAIKIKKSPPAIKSLAWSYFKIRYYSQALKTAKQLVKITPSDTHGWIILARTYIKLKRPNKALQILSTAHNHAKPKQIAFIESVEGDARFEKGDCNNASRHYLRALKAQPLLAGALLGLGKCHIRANSFKKAITYIRRAIRIRPKLSEAYYLLAKIYEKEDPNRSLRYLTIFAKQAKHDPEFLERVVEVRKKISLLKKQIKKNKQSS